MEQPRLSMDHPAKRTARTASPDVLRLQEMAKQLRRHVVRMTAAAGSGHPGGSMSAAEVVAALYFAVMRHRPEEPRWPERDRFILSKGHAAPVLYAALAESGYFPVKELSTLRKLGSCLQGHTDRNLTCGVEMSTGSLGMGLSFGVGVALAGRLDRLNYRTYVLLSDGECQEGQTWEAAMAAAHFKLDNLTAIVDYNKQQLSGWTRDILDIEPLDKKWQAFGWHTVEIDGHDLEQVIDSFEETARVKTKPSVIISHTVKGKGVSFMENSIWFHGKAPTAEEAERALKELE